MLPVANSCLIRASSVMSLCPNTRDSGPHPFGPSRIGWAGLASLMIVAACAGADASERQAGGFGMDTLGGLEGRVIRVTSLENDGVGTLRAALEAKGPRLVVFEVGGVIDLARKGMRVTEPHLTLAGQTAPDPGITLIRGALAVETHDVVVQHLSVRPGDAGRPRKSGWSPDGIAVNAAWNVIIDHCSATWAVDENLSVSGPRSVSWRRSPTGSKHAVSGWTACRKPGDSLALLPLLCRRPDAIVS
jgi:hypothetical protein